jgi:hypothetical protein
MTSITISSGHGLYVRGASGSPVPPQLDEVDTARWVVDRIAQYLEHAGVTAHVIHDNVSHSQSANLDWLVDQHNRTERTYDISVHMNAYDGNAHGCEVLYTSDAGRALAQELVDAICLAGDFTNRGPKERNDLAWLNGTEEVACLIELAFCDHTGDCQRVTARGDAICRAIAEVLAGKAIGTPPPTEPPEWPEDRPPEPEYLFYARGRMSTFGGPTDEKVSSSEGLAFFYQPSECPHLMLSEQPPGTTGMARRLDTNVFYVACRWPYDAGVPKDMLRNQMLKAAVRNPHNGKVFAAFPADWGPHEEETSGRTADLSPALAEALGLATDDECEVAYPVANGADV